MYIYNEGVLNKKGLVATKDIQTQCVLSQDRCILEDFTQFSKSHVWKLAMAFYDREGVESWAQGTVPHFVTSNAFIGQSYARILLGYIDDAMRSR